MSVTFNWMFHNKDLSSFDTQCHTQHYRYQDSDCVYDSSSYFQISQSETSTREVPPPATWTFLNRTSDVSVVVAKMSMPWKKTAFANYQCNSSEIQDCDQHFFTN